MPHVTPLRAADPRRVGRYRLAGRIAGMPPARPVYLASTVDGNEVTVTLLGDGGIGDSAARHRFAQEASTARRVAPFCVTRILDSGLDDGQAYLVSEYVTGSSLEEIVSARGARAGMDLGALALGAATGLAAIHQAGLVHGGFGPGHLILSPAGPRVVDFGITPPYGPATPAADMLAWGRTVVFAAAGRPDAGLRELGVLPANLGRLAAACLSTNPAARPAARLVVAALLGEENPPAGAGRGIAPRGRRRAGPRLAQHLRLAPRPDRPRPGRPVPAAPGPAAAPDSGPALIPVSAPAPGPPVPGRVPERPRPTASRRPPWPRRSTRHRRLPALPGRRSARRSPRSPGRRRPWRTRALPSRTTGRRRGAGAAVTLWAAVAAVAILGVVALLHSTLRPGAAGSAGAPPVPRPDRPRHHPPRRRPRRPRAHRALAGSWSGQARQVDPTDVFNVRLDLLTGGQLSTISYSGTTFSCSGELSPVSSAAGTLTLSQGIVTGETSCANGVVTLRQAGPTSLEFTFQGQAGPAARGTLAKG